MYGKPEVVKLVDAINAIQSLGAKVLNVAEHAQGQSLIATPNAYEADE